MLSATQGIVQLGAGIFCYAFSIAAHLARLLAYYLGIASSNSSHGGAKIAVVATSYGETATAEASIALTIATHPIH